MFDLLVSVNWWYHCHRLDADVWETAGSAVGSLRDILGTLVEDGWEIKAIKLTSRGRDHVYGFVNVTKAKEGQDLDLMVSMP